MMASQKERIRPDLIKATEAKPLHGDQLLYNHVIDLFAEMKVGWSPDTVAAIGKQVANQLTAALWYLDPTMTNCVKEASSFPILWYTSMVSMIGRKRSRRSHKSELVI